MSEILSWSESYCIGHPSFDTHHRHLFDILNVADGQARVSDADHTRTYIIDGLYDYAHSQFPSEESLMRQTSYPHLDHHVRSHRAFVTQVRAVAGIDDGSEYAINFLTEYLRCWILGHLLISDKKFGHFLGGKLGKAPPVEANHLIS